MTSSKDLRADTLATIARAPSPTRRQRHRQLVLLSLLAAAAALIVFLIAGGPRPNARPLSLMVATGAGSAILAALALVLAVGRGGVMSGRARPALLVVAAVLPLAFVAWRLGVSGLFDGMTASWPTRPGFRCLGLTIATALVPLAVALAARRGTAPRHPRTTSAAIGTACGLAGAALVDLWCPVSHLSHLLLGHLLPVALLAMIAAAVGARVFGRI